MVVAFQVDNEVGQLGAVGSAGGGAAPGAPDGTDRPRLPAAGDLGAQTGGTR